MKIEIIDLSKSFGPFKALKNLSLTIHSGELVALLGPSGSGKTTLLRLIAGLDFADNGKILFDGVDANTKRAKDRKVGFVFQHYALFKHMNVFENVAFGLRVKPRPQRPSRQEIARRVRELLKLVQLDWTEKRFPSQLSGGQRQRIALARALAVEPQVMLLDEPFGSLDAKVRKELRQWIRRLHDEIHVTSIFVTHDQEEALEVADRIVITNEGRIEQIGTPEEIYNQPASPFVYNFLGNVNLFRCRVEAGKAHIGKMTLDLSHPSQHDEKSSAVFVRPHELDIHLKPKSQNHFEAHILQLSPAGPFVKVELISEWGDPVHIELPIEKYRDLRLQKGDAVYVSPAEKNSGGTKYQLDTDVAEKSDRRKGMTIWLTGLPNAGKSTIAYLLKKKISEIGRNVELLDGDVMRTGISNGLSFSKGDRDANIRRMGFICSLLSRNGIVVIAAAASPYREAREKNRQMIKHYIEVYLRCPIEVCEARDGRGLYKKAREGQIKGFTGIDDPYEEPLNPEVICETDKESPETCADRVLDYLKKKGLMSGGPSKQD